MQLHGFLLNISCTLNSVLPQIVFQVVLMQALNTFNCQYLYLLSILFIAQYCSILSIKTLLLYLFAF